MSIAEQSARLEVAGGEAVELEAARGANPLGVSRGAAARLLVPGVAFEHARLVPTGIGWVCVASPSGAPLAVDGEPLPTREDAPAGRVLHDGARLALGETELVLRAPGAPPSAVPADDPSPAAELVRGRERLRRLEDEVVSLRDRLAAGEPGRLAAELAAVADERGAALARAAALEAELRARVARRAAQDDAEVAAYRARLEEWAGDPAHAILFRGEALLGEETATRRALEAEVEALRAQLAADERAHLERSAQLRARLARARAARAALEALSARAEAESGDARQDLDDARATLESLGGGAA